MKEMPPEDVSLSSMGESGRFARISGLARNLARVGNPPFVPDLAAAPIKQGSAFFGLSRWSPMNPGSTLVQALAADRRVILFDSAGLGESDGEVTTTLSGSASVAAGHIEALKPSPADVLAGRWAG